MIEVTEEQDGTFTISWDENDPLESVFNTWTEQDFIKIITEAAEKVLSQQEYCNAKVNPTKTTRESQNSNITEGKKEDWEDFWNSQGSWD